MTPVSITTPKKLGTTRRWNSIIVPDHRRSQSLSSEHKSTAIEAFRSTTSLGTFKPRDDEQLSILTTSSNTEAIVEEDYVQDAAAIALPASTSISPSRSSHSRQSFNTSPPPRPKPAPRLWDDDQNSNTSLRGFETTVAPNCPLPAIPVQSPPQLETLPAATFSPVSESPRSPKSLVSKFSTWKEKSFAGRRKGSVPDLELRSNNTTKPFNPNSPTLPPIHSGRTESTITTTGSITPRPFSNDPNLSDNFNYSALRTPEWQERDQKRASSMLLPSGLAPIVIPSIPARIPPVPPIDTSFNRTETDEERPPRPPPKSPRTLLRAFPIPKSSTMPGRHTANSSITSISPIDTPSTAATAWSPVSAYSTSMVHSPDTFGKSPSKFNTVTFEDPSQPASFQNYRNLPNFKHGRSVSNTHPEQRTPRKMSATALGNHSRMISDTSVMNRGRPMKRTEPIAIQRGPPRMHKIGSPENKFTELPQGIRKSQAGRIPVDELHGLRRDAEDRALNCNILNQKQIAAMDQEQQLLDESCHQMQNTISGLKEARRAIYNNLKLYLESPGLTPSTREHIMKQTQTLQGLDLQIDEWQNKLNMATDRKMSIQSKVWEHLTGILTAASLAAEVGRPEEYTPPRSPERVVRRSFTEDPIQEEDILNDFENSPRNDVESITVFADSGVANLLKSIEEELDEIDQARYYNGEEFMI